ncbi:MAG: hypothetical protein K0B14_15700 [Anaerolineaceae bacterium]|nr:hypothetical protein [Anaerolineaceae bacterium]
MQETTGEGDGGVCTDVAGVSAGRLGGLNSHAFFWHTAPSTPPAGKLPALPLRWRN